jgi:hypothetical protein
MGRMTQTSQEGTMTWILSQLEERPMSPLKSTVNSSVGCHQIERKIEEEKKGMIYLHHLTITFS